MKESRSLVANVALGVVSIAVSLIALEITCRLIYDTPKSVDKPRTDWVAVPERVWTEYHPTLGWYHQKSKSALLVQDELRVEVNTNSEGMRGIREYGIDKPAGMMRILLLGDSFAFGWGVKDNETFAARLEEMDPKLEVLNLGVAGYGLDQILLSFREIGRRFSPDLVFVTVFPEDFWRATRSFTDAGYAKPYFTLSGKDLLLHNVPTPQPFQLKHNQFPDVIESNRIEDFFEKSILYRLFRRGIIRMGKNLGWLDPDSTDEWILGREQLKTLIAEIKASEAQAIIVIVPPERWFKSTSEVSLKQSIRRFAQREQVPMIDLTPIFFELIHQSDITEYYIKDDWHWTAKGHQLAASVLMEFIIKNRPST